MRDQKVETARLNRSLHQEQEERKADSASHKEKTSDLYRSLVLEEAHRKDDNKRLSDETARLKKAIANEREERKAVVADLEGTIELQSTKLEGCERELKNAKEQHDIDMRDISEVCTTVLYSFLPHLSSHMSILVDSKVSPDSPPVSFGLQP